MSKDRTIFNANHASPDHQDGSDYAATVELRFDDLEAVAKAVLRQRKISTTVSKHLTPQFAEYEKADQKKQSQNIQIINAVSQPADSQASVQASNGVSIDSDVLDSILVGLAQLVDGLHRFAEEFGLKKEHVFSSGIKDVPQRGSATILHEWLKGQDQDASSKLDALFEDLAEHQGNLLTTLDTISRRTIKYLGPELTIKSVHGLSKFGPIWPHYKERNKRIAADHQSRYKIIIAPGVAYSYVMAKSKLAKKTN